MIDFEALGLSPYYIERAITVGLVREPSTSFGSRRFRTAADVFADFKPLADLDREVFLALHLDQKNRLNGVHLVSVGSLNASLVHPREVFKAAILSNAAAILVLHNHPSGDPVPSREDRDITARLKRSGETLGIPLMDHIIVALDGYRSAAEGGWL